MSKLLLSYETWRRVLELMTIPVYFNIARDFIKCLLRAHPEKRLTATEALQHKWITTETGNNADLLDNVKEGFNAKYAMHSTFCETRFLSPCQ